MRVAATNPPAPASEAAEAATEAATAAATDAAAGQNCCHHVVH